MLFLCTGNSCRSQIAEGWLRHLAGDRFETHSAGLKPSTVNPYAIKVMAEAGVDIVAQHSKDVGVYLGKHFPYLITVCDNAQVACPIFPGPAMREHWPLEDPADARGTEDEVLDVFRQTRDDVKARVEDFIERSNASASHPPGARSSSGRGHRDRPR